MAASAREGAEVGIQPLVPDAPLSADPASARIFRREFMIMSVTFGLNHATVTTPIIYASTVLTNSAGQGSNAVLYAATLVVSLFFSNLLFSLLGSKRGLSISMVLYAVYVFMFAVSTSLCAEHGSKGQCIRGRSTQMPVAILGAVVGGCGAGLLWTCQGAFFASSAERLAEAEGKDKKMVTADLAGTFGVFFLGFEAGVRALTTLLTKYAKLEFSVTFYIYAGLALASAVAFMVCATDLRSNAPAPSKDVCNKVLAAVKLWRDPKLWLLQSTNVTFGFAAAWLGGYVGKNILTPALDASFIGFAGALLSALAAVLSRVLGRVSQTTGKGPIVLLGAVSFAALGVLSKWVGNPAQWHWGTLVFYVLMGIGRAVYESTNKAIFADFFPGDKGPGAFANVFVFGTAASASAFVLGATDTSTAELYLLLVFACLTFPGFLLASALAKSEEARELQRNGNAV